MLFVSVFFLWTLTFVLKRDRRKVLFLDVVIVLNEFFPEMEEENETLSSDSPAQIRIQKAQVEIYKKKKLKFQWVGRWQDKTNFTKGAFSLFFVELFSEGNWT